MQVRVVDEPLAAIFPEIKNDSDSSKQRITIRQEVRPLSWVMVLSAYINAVV